jgi:outer membrane immunogenic protein
MKKLAIIAAIALIGTPTFAADMGVPPPAPAPVYNWTGWYVGGNLGVSLGTFKTDFNAPVTITANAGSPLSATADVAGNDFLYPGGFVGGGQIGFNWQFSPIWVVGLEGDFQGADEKEHSTLTNNFSVFVASTTLTGSTVLDYQTKIDWFGTARLRAGYLFGDGAVLTYVTGGLAYGRVEIDGTTAVTVPGFGSPTQAFGHSQVNTGWVVGTGTEGKLLIPGWTYKIEGLYMDLGHLDATGPGSSATVTIPATITTTTGVNTHTHFTDTILRLGVNYQFH